MIDLAHVYDAMNGLPVWPFPVIAALLAILGAYQVQRYVLFKNACTKFREALAPALSELKASKENVNVYSIFATALTKHAVAAEEFRPFAKNKTAFDAAWHKYKNGSS